jgi:uncharacterized protein YndB with AHSA1/START domain
MKLTLKYIGIGIVVVILSFIAMGLLHPTIEYESRTEIKAPIEKTFSLFNDTALMKNWMPGFSSITNISGNANEVGSKWKLVLVQKEEVYNMTETVTAFEKNKQFAFDMDNDVLVSNNNIAFSGDSTKTIIVAKTKVKGKNIFFRSMFVFSKPYFQEQQDLIYSQLKTMVETHP